MSLLITRRLVSIAAVGLLSLGVTAGAAAAADTGSQREKERVGTSSLTEAKQVLREKERTALREKERTTSREKERTALREKERTTSREKERTASREKE
jgi:hypothetical protein